MFCLYFMKGNVLNIEIENFSKEGVETKLNIKY